jgi:DNA-binding FrmR family transcriptional regulator
MGDERILARLRSAEGHLRGVREMVEKEAYCIDVIRQSRAVQAALDRVNALLLERHLNHCVSRALRSTDRGEQQRVMSELVDLFGRESRR